jgi:valyl-tRNA synthetase
MGLSKRYNPRTAEPELQAWWEEQNVYRFSLDGDAPLYSIDTPPATVSGHLHMGHAYSYAQTDFYARFWRMNGHNVFYPMGYDDNGLPTGYYVEKTSGVTAHNIGREAFVEKCLAMGEEAGREYRALWERLGLSVDWRHTYRTIDERSQRASQRSFLDLYDKGLIYRNKAPAIWCPKCGTAIAQAELDDLDRESVFYTLAFRLESGETLPIATTRPELLPACVAVFVHPDDARFKSLVGQQVTVPLFEQRVPLLEDPDADPEKGTGAVMCCTFGDVTDVAWWRTHHLPLIETIQPSGTLTDAAGDFAGLSIDKARREIVRALQHRGEITEHEAISQSVRVHERCDTPVEYVTTQQWFLRVLDYRERLLEAGEQIAWHPPHMKARYRQWVENLNWDWCLSRQRPFGVPFPLWHCPECEGIVLADKSELPVNPMEHTPPRPCTCGNEALTPEMDVMDTWATSSLTPQIAGGWLEDKNLYAQVYPMTLRPQAHDIIRTWAFYTIVKSVHHFGTVPWQNIAISGWGIAGEGMGKISKSRGGGPMPPMDVIQAYSADAVRYWAASISLGKDAVISEQKIQLGHKLANKLWNVARFSQRFLLEYSPPAKGKIPPLSPADRWILSRAQRLIWRTTEHMRNYEHAAAKNETEAFFWTELADNYLEMAKLRLYDETDTGRPSAQFALYHTLLTVLKLFAPFLPYVTERIYRGLYATQAVPSIHTSAWPIADGRLEDQASEETGAALVAVATAVRRFKSERNLSLGAELRRIELMTEDQSLAKALHQAKGDLASITRAREVHVDGQPSPELETIPVDGPLTIALALSRSTQTPEGFTGT